MSQGKSTTIAIVTIVVFLLGLGAGYVVAPRKVVNIVEVDETGSGPGDNPDRRVALGQEGPGGGAGGLGGRGVRGQVRGKTGAGGSNFVSHGERASGVQRPLRGPGSEPPIPSPGALEEGDEVKRELAEKGRGGGRVTPLVNPFRNPEERQAWEERRRRTWQKRLAREIDIKLRNLKEKVGLSNSQSEELRRILVAANVRRGELVAKLSSKQISRTSFDNEARQNIDNARQQVRSLLNDQQWKAYVELKPREQVLRDELK